MPEPVSQKKVNLYPLLYCAATFASGILLRTAFSLNEGLIAAAIVAFSGAAFFLRNSSTGTIFVLLAFFCGGAYCSLREADNIRPDRIRMLIDKGVIASGSPVEVDGTLAASPEPSANGYFITVDVDNISSAGRSFPASGRVRLYSLLSDASQAAEFDGLDLRYGTHIKTGFEIFREEQYQNPGVASRIELLDRRGIDATGTLKSPLLIENLGDESGPFSLRWAYSFRENLLTEIHSRFSPSTAGVLTASMLGDKYFLDKPTAEVFRQGGTFHVLVISGLHITFIGGVLLLLASVLTQNRIVRFTFVTLILWSYTIAVGAEAPVVRASLMFTIMMLSQVLNRQGSLLNSLGACVLVLLALRPSDLFDPSLQLTLTSVVALVGMAFPLIDKLRSIGKWMPSAQTPFPPNVPHWLVRFCESLYWNPVAWNIESSRQIWSAKIIKSPFVPLIVARVGRKTIAYTFEGLLASLIVQIWLLPLLIIYFHRLTPVSIVMNLWVGVVIALESFAALIAISLGTVSTFLAAPFFIFTEFFNYLLTTAPSFVTHPEWSSWRVPNYSGWSSLIYVIYFLPVLVLAIALWRWHPFGVSEWKFRVPAMPLNIGFATCVSVLSVTCLLLISIVVFHPFSAATPDGRLHVDFLDVGQGDSALITFPDGETMLVDGGGRPVFHSVDDAVEAFVPDSPGIGESVVSPVLWNMGYSKIDYILATHADADHIQGLTDVASNFQIGHAFFGRMPLDNSEFRGLESVLKSRDVPEELISRGKSMHFGDAAVEVLYPRFDPSPGAASDNNHSVVLRIVYGTRAFLLTGDIEQEAEDQLVNGGGILKADVIKVAHHGSRTSSTKSFIDDVRPEYALISVGKHSRFGHPHKEIVDSWLTAGAKVITTGQRGMVSASTDGKDLSISSYR